MAFPSSPTVGQEYDESGIRFYWDGTVWRVKGHIGPAGPPGQVGAQGIQGTTGIQGLTGIQGPLGVQGLRGLQGIQGATGSGVGDMLKSENLSGLANYTTARSNLGLGTGNTVTFTRVNLPSGVEDRTWTPTDTDIDGLIPGTAGGRLSTSSVNGHYVIGIKSNDANDGLYVIDQGDVGTTGAEPYINVVMQASRSGFIYNGPYLSISNTTPTLLLSESDTDTAARFILTGGTGYLQVGAAGSGTTSSSGNLAFSGYLGADISVFQVRHSGAWRNIWHAGNFSPASYLRSDTSDTFTSGILDFAQGTFIKFVHASATDGNDGVIGAGIFASGLNIVGAQTAAGTGRQVRIWGNLIDSSGNTFWHSGNLQYISNQTNGIGFGDTGSRGLLLSSGAGLELNNTDNSGLFLKTSNTTRVTIGAAGGVTLATGNILYSTVPNNTAMGTTTGGQGAIEIYNNSTGASFLSFHRVGAYAAYLGVNTDNTLSYGGWSEGAIAYKVLHEGLTGAYNIRGTPTMVTGFKSTQASTDANNNLESGFILLNPSATGAATTDWQNVLRVRGPLWNDSSKYLFELSHPFFNDELYVRRITNNSASAWRPVAHMMGSGAVSGRITWGTAAPGTLAVGEIYLRYT